jgi:hypothetical protein
MGLVLYSLLTLIAMYATLRSPILGLSAAVAMGLGIGVTGGAQVDWLPIVAGGVLMGVLARAHWRPASVVLTSGGVAGSVLALIGLAGDRELLRTELMRALESQADALQVGAEPPMIEQLADLLLMMVPATAILSVVVALAIAYAVATHVFPRLGVPVAPLEPMATWRTPFVLAWSFSAGLVMVLVGPAFDARGMTAVGLNLVLVHAAAFFVVGLAIIRHWLGARGINRSLQFFVFVLLILMALVVPPFGVLIAFLGLFDIWFNLRKLVGPPAPGDQAAG